MTETTMKNTNYNLKFWHGQFAEWRPCVLRPFDTLEKAQKALKAHIEMTGGSVDFRIVEEVA